MKVLTLVRPEFWAGAGWSGVAFVGREGSPPILALAFLNPTAARAIFHDWHTRIGRNDPLDQLRIAIVEGDLPNQDSGYSVHITPGESLFRDAQPDAFLTRVHRMNPPKDSRNLSQFKSSFAVHGRFLLTWASLGGPQGFEPHIADGIAKSHVHLRQANSVPAGR